MSEAARMAKTAGQDQTTDAQPGKPAAEAFEIFERIMANAKSTKPNGIEVAWLPMQFALRDRLTRLCAALGVEVKPDAAS